MESVNNRMETDRETILAPALDRMWKLFPSGMMICTKCGGYGATVTISGDGKRARFACPCGHKIKFGEL